MVVKSSSGTAIQDVLDALTAPQDAAPAAEAESEEGTMPEDNTTTIEAPEAAAPEAPVEKAAEVSVEEFLKSAPEGVAKAFAEMQKAVDAATALQAEAAENLRKEREARETTEATEYAKSAFAHIPTLDPVVVGPALHALKAINSDLFDTLHAALLATDAQVESADIFTEVGKSTAGGAGGGDVSAYDRLTSMAKSAVEKGEHTSHAAAFTAAVEANPDLYTDYLNEKGA